MTPEEMNDLFQMIQVHPNPMSIDDLIAASKRLSLSQEAVEKFEQCIREREEQYRSEYSPITEEFLNKKYGE